MTVNFTLTKLDVSEIAKNDHEHHHDLPPPHLTRSTTLTGPQRRFQNDNLLIRVFLLAVIRQLVREKLLIIPFMGYKKSYKTCE